MSSITQAVNASPVVEAPAVNPAPAPEAEVTAVNPEVARKNVISRARRVAWRHHLRIVSFHLPDGTYSYGFETKIPIVGPGNNSRALSIDELVSFCETLAAKEVAQ